jgi:hypothetical protein
MTTAASGIDIHWMLLNIMTCYDQEIDRLQRTIDTMARRVANIRALRSKTHELYTEHLIGPNPE